MAVMLITHAMGVVAETAQRVVVMYAGKVVEEAPVEELFGDPRHPYTQGLIRSIEQDLNDGHTAVIQIVSTGEALMERRLADLPTEEWNDVRVDITPREYVLDYLAHSFPVQLYEPFTDSEGNLSSRPVYRDGQLVESREAAARRLDERVRARGGQLVLVAHREPATLRDLGATDVRTVLDTVIMEDPHVLTERPEELDPLRLVVWTGHVPR